jgi:hypothetical protein
VSVPSRETTVERCPRDSDWCDGLTCVDHGVLCPRSDVARVAENQGCIGPFPCGRGAGANGSDLPCDCEHTARTGEATP